MKIDLHIHSKDGSDGKMGLADIFRHAAERKVDLISITDHDSIEAQEKARDLAIRHGIRYLTGVELNIRFSHPAYRDAKPISLDMLGYGFHIHDAALNHKLGQVRAYRRERAEKILEKLNFELQKERKPLFTQADLRAIEETVDGSFGRPHIANYLIKKGLVRDKQEAFDKYLVKCNVPKLPVTLEEAAGLIHEAGGKLILAHPNDPNGTSLVSLTPSLDEQIQIIREAMLPHLDGVECWHSRHDPKTISAYRSFAAEMGLLATGGSDCHQQPLILGTVDIPDFVAAQFD